MAQPYVTGPALLYVGVTSSSPGGTSNKAVFLGTAEQSPVIEIRPDYEPVFNDLRGSKKPFDLAFEGEEAFTFADLTRWNESVYAALAARPRAVSALGAGGAVAGGLGLAPTRGVNIAGDIGTLQLTENQSFTLWVVFPYASKPAMASMPAGYRFPFTVFEGPDLLKPLGTRPRKIHVVFHHMAGFNPATGAFFTYDTNTAGLPGIN